MFRHLVSASVVVALAVVTPSFAGGEPQAPGTQRELEGSLTAMQARLDGPGHSPQAVINDAQLLAASYRGFGRTAGRFGPADRDLNRRLGQRSFNWLWRARALYPRHAGVNAQLLAAYGALGGFYRDYPAFYPAAAFTAFGAASRVARGLVLAGGSQYEQDLERYALAYATAAYAYGPLYWGMLPSGAPEPPRIDPGQKLPVSPPVELPAIESSSLSAEQRAQWADVQDRFRPTSARVHEARVRMSELAARLGQRGLTTNAQDAATAAKMQGFLEDAVELIKAHEFALANEALTRADYSRTKLKNVIGQ